MSWSFAQFSALHPLRKGRRPLAPASLISLPCSYSTSLWSACHLFTDLENMPHPTSPPSLLIYTYSYPLWWTPLSTVWKQRRFRKLCLNWYVPKNLIFNNYKTIKISIFQSWENVWQVDTMKMCNIMVKWKYKSSNSSISIIWLSFLNNLIFCINKILIRFSLSLSYSIHSKSSWSICSFCVLARKKSYLIHFELIFKIYVK